MFNWSYLRTQPHLAVRRDAPLNGVQSLQQLAGMEIGWVGGTTVPAPLQGVFGAGRRGRHRALQQGSQRRLCRPAVQVLSRAVHAQNGPALTRRKGSAGTA